MEDQHVQNKIFFTHQWYRWGREQISPGLSEYYECNRLYMHNYDVFVCVANCGNSGFTAPSSANRKHSSPDYTGGAGWRHYLLPPKPAKPVPLSWGNSVRRIQLCKSDSPAWKCVAWSCVVPYWATLPALSIPSGCPSLLWEWFARTEWTVFSLFKLVRVFSPFQDTRDFFRITQPLCPILCVLPHQLTVTVYTETALYIYFKQWHIQNYTFMLCISVILNINQIIFQSYSWL